MRVHLDLIRHTLMAGCLHTRVMDVTDEVVHLLLESIRRLEPQTEQHVRKVLP
jgi:hypothetical protein